MIHRSSRLASSRSSVAGLFVLALAVLVPAAALAQPAPPPANPQAESLNDQGKELYKNKDYQGAAAKFREANNIQPDARFFFNLCATLEKAGDLDGALEACDSVYQYGPNDELKAKTGQRAAAIRQSIRQRNAGQAGNQQPPPGDGGNQQPPPGNGNQQVPVGDGTGGPGGPPGPEISKPVPGEYKWAFGGEFGPILAADFTNGNVSPNLDAGGLLRLYADKTFGNRLGGRAFLGVGGLSQSAGGLSATLTIVEFGASGFTNVKLGSNLFITPMVGVLIAGLQESGDFGTSDSVGTFGFALGLPISLTLGGGKHVLTFNPAAFTYYLPSNTNNNGVNTSFDGGSTFMITFGYQMRLQEGEKLPGFVVLE